MLVVYQSVWFCFVVLSVNLSVSYEWDRLSLGRVTVRRFGLPKPALQLTQATTDRGRHTNGMSALCRHIVSTCMSLWSHKCRLIHSALCVVVPAYQIIALLIVLNSPYTPVFELKIWLFLVR